MMSLFIARIGPINLQWLTPLHQPRKDIGTFGHKSDPRVSRQTSQCGSDGFIQIAQNGHLPLEAPRLPRGIDFVVDSDRQPSLTIGVGIVKPNNALRIYLLNKSLRFRFDNQTKLSPVLMNSVPV
jgi:hypothetical protein